MFDVKKRRIIPDILSEIRTKEGRLDLKSAVMANYRFDNTKNTLIINRSNHSSGTSDLYLFDDLKSKRSFSLDNDNPFTKIGKEQNYFLHQPDGFNSKLLSRYTGKSLSNKHLKGAEAKIEILSGTRASGGGLHKASVEIIGYNQSGNVTKKYYFIENSSFEFSEPVANISIKKGNTPNSITYLSESFSQRLGFTVSLMSGTQGSNDPRYKNFFVNPNSQVTVATARGTGYVGTHHSSYSDGYTVEVPHLPTDTGATLLTRLCGALTGTWGGHASNVTGSFSDAGGEYLLKIKHKKSSFESNSHSEKNRWDTAVSSYGLDNLLVNLSGSLAERKRSQDYIGTTLQKDSVVLSILSASNVLDLGYTSPSFTAEYAGNSWDFYFGYNDHDSSTVGPIISYNSGRPRFIHVAPNIYGSLGSTKLEMKTTHVLSAFQAAANAASNWSDNSSQVVGADALDLTATMAPGGKSVILTKNKKPANTKLTITGDLNQNWENKTLLLTGSNFQIVEFNFTKLTGSIDFLGRARREAQSSQVFSVGIKNDNTGVSYIKDQLIKAINIAHQTTNLNITASSHTSNTLKIQQFDTGEKGNTLVQGSVFASPIVATKLSNFLSGSGDGELIISGSDITDGKFVISSNQSKFNFVDQTVRETGLALREGDWIGDSYLPTGDSRIGGISVRYDLGENELYNVFTNFSKAVNLNESSGYVTASMSESQDNKAKVIVNSVVSPGRSILTLSQSNPGIGSNTTLKMSGSVFLSQLSLDIAIPNLSFTQFEGGISKLGVATLDNKNLNHIDKKTFIFRIKVGTTQGLIFSIAKQDKPRYALFSGAGSNVDLIFRAYTSDPTQYWQCRINTLAGGGTISENQWLTVVISVDENTPGSGIENNYMAILDSTTNGRLLNQKGFTPVNSPLGTVSNFSDTSNYRMFLGFGDSTSAVPSDFFNDSQPQLDLSDFHDDFKISELSILNICLPLELANKFAESYYTGRAKSGFRGKIPKEELDLSQRKSSAEDSIESRPFVDSDQTSPVPVIRDLIYPNMLPAPEVGTLSIKFNREPTDGEYFVIKKPDDSELAIKFGPQNALDVSGTTIVSDIKVALTGSTHPGGILVAPANVATDHIYAWFPLNDQNIVNPYPDASRRLKTSNNRTADPTGGVPTWDSSKNDLPQSPGGAFRSEVSTSRYWLAHNTHNVNDFSFLNNQSFTISFWINIGNPRDASEHNQPYGANDYIYPIYKGNISQLQNVFENTLVDFEYLVRIKPRTGEVLFALYGADSQVIVGGGPAHTSGVVVRSWTSINGASPMQAGWNHVVVTYDGQSRTYTREDNSIGTPFYGYAPDGDQSKRIGKIYINGNQASKHETITLRHNTSPNGTQSYDSNTDWPNEVTFLNISDKTNHKLAIGYGPSFANQGSAGDANFGFYGWLSDVAIWTKAISPAEVLTLYTKANAGYNNYYLGDLSTSSAFKTSLSGTIDYSVDERDSLQASIQFGENTVSDITGKMTGDNTPIFAINSPGTVVGSGGLAEGSTLVPVTSEVILSGSAMRYFDFTTASPKTALFFGKTSHWQPLLNPGSGFGADQNQGEMTIIAWVNVGEPDSTTNPYHIVDFSKEIQFAVLGNNKLYLQLDILTNGGGVAAKGYFCHDIINDNEWLQVAISFKENDLYNADAQVRFPKFYVNGKKLPTVTESPSGAINANQQVEHLNNFDCTIGNDINYARNFKGSIGDVYVFNRSLSHQQIIDIFNNVKESLTKLKNEELVENFVTFINNTNRYSDSLLIASKNETDPHTADLKLDIAGSSKSGFSLNSTPLSVANPLYVILSGSGHLESVYPAHQADPTTHTIQIVSSSFSDKFAGFANADLDNSPPSKRIIVGALGQNKVSSKIACNFNNLNNAYELGEITNDVITLFRNARNNNQAADIWGPLELPENIIDDEIFNNLNVNEIPWPIAEVNPPRYPAISFDISGITYSARFFKSFEEQPKKKSDSNIYNICIDDVTNDVSLAESLKNSIDSFISKYQLGLSTEISDSKIVNISVTDPTIDTSNVDFKGFTTASGLGVDNFVFVTTRFNPTLNPTIAVDSVSAITSEDNNVIKPFIDSADDNNPFLQERGSPKRINQIKIEIPINPSKSTSLGYMTGSGTSNNNLEGFNHEHFKPVGYFNFGNNTWESITTGTGPGASVSKAYPLSYTSNISYTAGSPDTESHYPTRVTGSIQEFIKVMPFAFGPGQGFTIQNSLSSVSGSTLSNTFDHPGIGDLYDIEFNAYARPISTFGFPFDSKFSPTDDQKINMSAYLENDFVLTGFEIVVSSSIEDSVTDGLGYDLSTDFLVSSGSFAFTTGSSYLYGSNVYYNPRPKLINEASGMRKLGLSHPVYGFVSGSKTDPDADMLSEATGSMLGFSLGSPGSGNVSVIRDGSRFDRAMPWWRCDTFFLMREKPFVNETISTNIFVDQLNMKITASHPANSLINPYTHAHREEHWSLFNKVPDEEIFDFSSNINISGGKTQELISYSQVSYYGYVTKEFLSGTTHAGSTYPAQTEQPFDLEKPSSQFDQVTLFNFVGLSADEMADSIDYITSGYEPIDYLEGNNGPSDSTLKKGYSIDQQKYGSFLYRGGCQKSTWLESGLGRDLNIMIGRDFGNEWLSKDQNTGLATSGRASHYKAIDISKLSISSIIFVDTDLYSTNNNLRLSKSFFAGYESELGNESRRINKNGSAQLIDGATDRAALENNQKLYSGILTLRAPIRETPNYQSNFKASLLHADQYTPNYARDNSWLVNMSGSTPNYISLSTNTGHKFANILPSVLYANNNSVFNNGGYTDSNQTFLRNLKVGTFWTGGNDPDGLGSPRRIKHALGGELFNAKVSYVDSRISPVNSGINYLTGNIYPDANAQRSKNLLKSHVHEYRKNYDIKSNYILKKNDNLILGFQVGLPGFSNSHNGLANVGGGNVPSLLRGGSIQTQRNQIPTTRKTNRPPDFFYPRCHQAHFHPYENSKLVLYGYYLKDEKPFVKKGRQVLGANIVHEYIGERFITDRFDTELSSELTGSIFSELYGKTEVGPFVPDGVSFTPIISVTMSEARTNDVGGSPKRMFASGSVQRFMNIYKGDKIEIDRIEGEEEQSPGFTSYDEIYYDSLPVDLTFYINADMIHMSGSRIDISSGANYNVDSNVPDGDIDDTPDDFDPANVIGRKSNEPKIPEYFVGIGAFNPEYANIYWDGSSLTGSIVDNYVGLTQPSFEKVYSQRFVKSFLFHSSSLKASLILPDGTSQFDPQDARLISNDHTFGLAQYRNQKGLDENARFGILINPDSHQMIAFSTTAGSYSYPDMSAIETTVPQSPGTTGDTGEAQSASDVEIIKGFYSGASGYKQLGVATIGGGQIMEIDNGDGTSTLRLSKHSRYTPTRMLNGVDQVNDTELRRNAAFVFGFGTRSDRGHRYLYGNGFVPSTSTGALVTGYDVRASTDTKYNRTKDYRYHQYDTRIVVDHPAGVKYGMMNYDKLRPSVKFSRNHYGHFRDLLEGRKLSAIVINEVEQQIGNYDKSMQDLFEETTAGSQISAVVVRFVDRLGRPLIDGNASRKFLRSQNLDKFSRSSVPFFDLPTKLDGVPPGEYSGGYMRKDHEMFEENVEIDLEIPDDQFL